MLPGMHWVLSKISTGLAQVILASEMRNLNGIFFLPINTRQITSTKLLKKKSWVATKDFADHLDSICPTQQYSIFNSTQIHHCTVFLHSTSWLELNFHPCFYNCCFACNVTSPIIKTFRNIVISGCSRQGGGRGDRNS